MDIHSIKVHDNWVRDNFYSLNLGDEPYYDLVEIPIKNHLMAIDALPSGTYVAGGAALFMAGGISTYDDIDLFTTDMEAAISWLESLSRSIYKIRSTKHAITRYTDGGYSDADPNIQLIKRIYSCPSEVVHGFDLDCVGVIWDGKSLWATKRAMYSMKNKINWFDPTRMSPSYVHRLCKYMKRGYDMMIPHIDSISIDDERVLEEWTKLKLIVDGYIKGRRMDEYRDTPIPEPIKKSAGYGAMQGHIRLIDMYEKAYRSTAGMKSILEEVVVVNRPIDTQKAERYMLYIPEYEMPSDDASILIMAYTYGYYPYDTPSDYEPTLEEFPIREGWIGIDPMRQLTGTFDPSEINGEDAFITWMKRSPLIR